MPIGTLTYKNVIAITTALTVWGLGILLPSVFYNQRKKRNKHKLKPFPAKAQDKELNHEQYRVGDKNDVRQYFIGKNQNSVSYFIFLKKPHGFLI